MKLWNFPHLLFVFLQVPLRAILQDDIPGPTHAEVIDVSKYVLVLQDLHKLYLFLGQGFVLSNLSHTEVFMNFIFLIATTSLVVQLTPL